MKTDINFIKTELFKISFEDCPHQDEKPKDFIQLMVESYPNGEHSPFYFIRDEHGFTRVETSSHDINKIKRYYAHEVEYLQGTLKKDYIKKNKKVADIHKYFISKYQLAIDEIENYCKLPAVH